MTRGDQRERDRARAQVRAAKYSKDAKVGHSVSQQQKMDQAEIMREKQRRAELKKQGIDPDADTAPAKKEYDTSYLKQYGYDDGDEDGDDNEEEKKDEDTIETKPVKQPYREQTQSVKTEVKSEEMDQHKQVSAAEETKQINNNECTSYQVISKDEDDEIEDASDSQESKEDAYDDQSQISMEQSKSNLDL